MSDENTTPLGQSPTPPSGSRWEPRTDATDAPATTPAARSTWSTRVRGRGGLLAGAAALVLVAGVGGFAIAEVGHHPDGARAPFGVGYQPQDARFPAPPPGFGDDDGGFDGHGFGDDDGSGGGQLGGGSDDGTQQGSSL